MKARTKIVKCACGKDVERSEPAIAKANKLGRLVFCDECLYAKRHPKYSLEEAKIKKGNKKWKGVVSFECSECKKHSTAKYSNLVSRKYGKLLPICNDCIMKWTTNTIEWREANSKAQLIAQNRPEQKELNSKRVKEACRKEIVKERKSAAIKKAYRDNPDYKRRVIENLNKYRNDPKNQYAYQKNNRFHTGHYKGIFFNSGWELMYLLYCEKNNIVIERFKGSIPYEHEGKKRRYIPDFVVNFDGKKIIVEIKGRYSGSEGLIEPKKKAALKFISKNNEYDDYVIYRKNELINLGIDLRDIKIKETINGISKSNIKKE